MTSEYRMWVNEFLKKSTPVDELSDRFNVFTEKEKKKTLKLLIAEINELYPNKKK